MSNMVPPATEKVATVVNDVTMYGPSATADPMSLMLVQFGIIDVQSAVRDGILVTRTIPAGTTGIVVEECAGECEHFQVTGIPCAYVVKITTLGEWHGEEVVMSGEEVTVTVADEATWSPADDVAVFDFLSDLDGFPLEWDGDYGDDEWGDRF